MKVYTKTGDSGETSLLSRQRVAKDNIRVEAYGTVDEASAAIGLARSLMAEPRWALRLADIQNELILLNADLATAGDPPAGGWRIQDGHVAALESTIDQLEQVRIPQRRFVIPGDCPASAALDLARTTVRRAERCVIRLKRVEPVPAALTIYLNRLSDLLFVLARCVEQQVLVQEVTKRVMALLDDGAANGCSGRNSMLARAKQAIAAAEHKANAIGVPMVIAVVDAGGNLVAQHNMDGALLVSSSLAADKAYTAVALRIPTEELAGLVQPGGTLYGLGTSAGGRIITFGGGIPILEGGCVVGAIGVSGGSVTQDIEVAAAGLSAWH